MLSSSVRTKVLLMRASPTGAFEDSRRCGLTLSVAGKSTHFLHGKSFGLHWCS